MLRGMLQAAISLQRKEKIMNTADMLIYVHPTLDAKSRSALERTVEGCVGVDCAQFDAHTHHHAMMVRYDPDAIQGMQILNLVRNADPAAAIVGL
ncbi:hypothetical protein GALL_03220 [mine drainage metagenome]|uniref:Uncharacterized protein n=1 Tax=mine drainage metagenome TaxID=410659 RepID=A0A1J5TES0_9ZZZZ